MNYKKLVNLFIILSCFITFTNCSKDKTQTPPKDMKENILNLVGKKIPSAAVKNSSGETFNLQEIPSSAGASVLIFYRGGWCPYCNKHLGQLQTIEKQLIELGYTIYAISPDKSDLLKNTSEKNKLNYILLSDSKMEAAKALGINFTVDEETLKKYKEYGIDLEATSGETHHMLPHPTALVVDKEGIIQFAYVNKDYKVRIQPDALLKAAQGAKK